MSACLDSHAEVCMNIALTVQLFFLSLSLSSLFFSDTHTHANKAEQTFHSLMISVPCNSVIDRHHLPLLSRPLSSSSFYSSILSPNQLFLLPLPSRGCLTPTNVHTVAFFLSERSSILWPLVLPCFVFINIYLPCGFSFPQPYNIFVKYEKKYHFYCLYLW